MGRQYWLAYSHARGHKYACIFSEAGDAPKFLNAITSGINNPLRVANLHDFHEELRDNFIIKPFSSMIEAEKFQKEFLAVKPSFNR